MSLRSRGLRFVCAVLAATLMACAHAGQPSSLPSSATSQPRVAVDGQDGPVVVLWEQGRYTIETDGTKTYMYQVRYQVKTSKLGPSWKRIEARWQPWLQAQPELWAQITRRDGSTVEFDPATIVVQVADITRVDPRMRVIGEMPTLKIGDVVEQRILYRDVRPLSPSGASGRFFFGMQVPVERSELIIDVPEELDVKIDVRGIDAQPVRSQFRGRKTLSYSVLNLPSLRSVSAYLPSDEPRFPHVAFSTVRSWNSVVAPLAKRFARSMRAAEVDGIVDEFAPQKADLDTLVSLATAQVRRSVRPTGRSFGEGPLAPMHPEETLARRAGDDDDLALLLVAVLRASGLDASVALLRSGPGEDTLPTQPGLSGFNRAVVAVRKNEGEEFLWVDPTASYTPAGQLPSGLEGRWALVVAPDTQKLLRTPESSFKDNVYIEQRTVKLPQYGRATVYEKTKVTGTIAALMRSQIASRSDPKAALLSYIEGEYGTKQLESSRHSDLSDTSRPLVIEMEAGGAQVGGTDIFAGWARVKIAVLLSWLPAFIREAATTNKDSTLQAALSRERPLYLPLPYTAELHFEVVAPKGFSIARYPEDRVVSVGPAQFAIHSTINGDRLKGVARFETGPKRRYEPNDIRDLISDLRALRGDLKLNVLLEHQPIRAVTEGKVRVGLRESSALAQANPRSAEHRARLAMGLLEVGFGDAARLVAREAVSLAPTSVLARYALGRVLAHDQVGQLHGPGFDRQGAIDAFSLVKALEPNNARARAELAVLRLTDRRGQLTLDPARLEAAVAEYRSLREDTGMTLFNEELIEALFWAERFEEVLVETKGKHSSLKRTGHAIAAQVAMDGHVDGLETVLRALDVPQDLNSSVTTAGALALTRIGRYEEAFMLLQRVHDRWSGMGPVAAVLAERIQNAGFRSKGRGSGQGPVQAIRSLLNLVFAGKLSIEELSPLMSASLKPAQLQQEIVGFTHFFLQLRQAAHRSGVPRRLFQDELIANLQFEVEGSKEHGFRVRVKLENQWIQWFVQWENAQSYRVVSSEISPWILGQVALKALNDGQTAKAKQWLKWADALLEKRTPLVEGEEMFRQPSYPLLRRDWPNEYEAAALALMALGPGAEAVAPRLTPQIRTTTGRLNDVLRLVRVQSLARRKRWTAVRRELARLEQKHPHNAALAGFQVGALIQQERWGWADKKIQLWLREHPSDPQALGSLANLRTAQGRFEEAQRILKDLIERSQRPAVYNNLAWLSLFRGEVAQKHLQWAQTASSLSSDRGPTELHTLAAVHAEFGHAKETISIVRRRMNLLGSDAPESADYYLFGRLLEYFGLRRLARKAYRRVRNNEGGRADSTHALAQRRLRLLRVQP